MLSKKWQRFLTDTDVIPTNKPLFPLKFLFILALCASVIFYRFVYIYLYEVPISKYLYDYKISYTSKTYIEGFFLSTWVIFIVVLLFRISNFILDKFIMPLLRITYIIILKILYGLDLLTEKTYNIFKRKKIFTNTNKDFTKTSKHTKMEKSNKRQKISNDRRKERNKTLSRTQRKTS